MGKLRELAEIADYGTGDAGCSAFSCHLVPTGWTIDLR
jgi:hypothetical protein